MNDEQLKYVANLISQDLEKDKEIERLKENERLKIQLNNADNKNLELIEELNKEIDRYEDTISFELGYDRASKDYKSRIGKAIELINAWLEGFNNDDIIILLNNLGNILNGDDENDN